MSGARAATSAADSAAPAPVNGRKLLSAFAEAPARQAPTALREAERAVRSRRLPALVESRLAVASGMALFVIVLAATVPAISTALAAQLTPSGTESAGGTQEAPAELAAAAAPGGWERAWAASAPPADQVQAMLMAAAAEQARWDNLRFMLAVGEQEAARQAEITRQQEAARQAEAARQRQAAAARPRTLSGSSGGAAGSVIYARVTIYGCVGPGGGFCGGMASGITVFEGAVACSYDLAIGTRLRISGDPTGRVYECLDRGGGLSPTWIDVYFYDTSEGMAWQGSLGTTYPAIEILN